MSVVFRRGPARIEANLTPMIDVTFLLIVFFVLVSQIVDLENEDLELPAPRQAVTEVPGDEERAVINVTHDAGGVARGYVLGGMLYTPDTSGVERLTADLAARLETNPRLRVNLRADRAIHYRWVEPAMLAIAEAARRAGGGATAGVNLVVVREE